VSGYFLKSTTNKSELVNLIINGFSSEINIENPKQNNRPHDLDRFYEGRDFISPWRFCFAKLPLILLGHTKNTPGKIQLVFLMSGGLSGNVLSPHIPEILLSQFWVEYPSLLRSPVLSQCINVSIKNQKSHLL
jgi:hypothetical protein